MAGIYGATSRGAASPYGAPTARRNMPNGQPEMNRPEAPQGPSYGGMPRPGKPQGPSYGQNPQALAAALSSMAPQMGSHTMLDGSMMPNSAMPGYSGSEPKTLPQTTSMPAQLGAPMPPMGAPTMPAATQPAMPAQMPMMGKPADPMAAQRKRDMQMAGVMR